MCALPNYYVKHDSLPLVSCGSLRSINPSSPVYRSSSVAYIIPGLADPPDLCFGVEEDFCPHQ
jgi:hypothetical protein